MGEVNSQELETIEIQNSKTAFFVPVVLSLIVVVFGVYFLPEIPHSVDSYSKALGKLLIGVLLICFAGIGGYFGFRNIIYKPIGLIISKEGIIDNSNIGFIPWSNIEEFYLYKIRSHNFIAVYLYDSDAYFDKANWLVRRALIYSDNLVGTPISVAIFALKINDQKLLKLLNSYLKRYGNSKLE